MSPVIRVENLSKQYRLGQVGTGTLSDDLTRLWYRMRGKEDPFLKIGQTNDRTKKAAPPIQEKKRGIFSRLSPLAARRTPLAARHSSSDLVWALQDINFEVQEGEVLGIIGRNGAGKSTLLKILARVTTPTTGQVKVKGRIASLLEVGTGFHPDLSGRENIYLNGAILGMRKHEITRKLDEIIDFSGCERYIDTPVKRYSSGMYVRLAFAVAAHLDPEILIIDEVLAVGDVEFQRKCMGKMKDVSSSGRTVLFVSHNMAILQNLCNRGLVLLGGQRLFLGSSEESISVYFGTKSVEHGGIVSLAQHPARRKECRPILQSVRFLDRTGRQSETIVTGQPLTIEFLVRSEVALRNPQFGIGIDCPRAGRLFSVTTYLSCADLGEINAPTKVRCRIESFPLLPGRYFLSLSAGTGRDILMDAIDDAVYIDVVADDYFGNGAAPSSGVGPVAVRSNWECDAI